MHTITKKKEKQSNMSELQNIFQNKQFKCSVSSVLNKDVKQYGKPFMFDGLEDTAWYSDQGLPQSINIVFNEPLESLNLSLCQLKIKFQGGFVGNVMTVSLDDINSQNIYKKSFYPDDINDLQTFTLDANTNGKSLGNVRKLSIVFEKSSDFFGRIIIYSLELMT
ncbi:nuclear receptor 2C2-associated protein [Contarinia nasturtii]|uniref:nuclear receptor 2C2-associated protein n=1 Tax=Contarinia nasturtii TaxID=265458 RepID=UPI0012D4634B|nr:nuclear receptor 2C2-associated protein [Contarinia nasturtii]